MGKALGFISTGLSYLVFAGKTFAAAINIEPPVGSATNITIEKIPQFVVSILFVIGIVIAIAFFIYGGIKWILSGGDKTAVESARNHIVAAVVGLVIIIAAFFILTTVIQLITGQEFRLDALCIPTLANPTCQPQPH